jgi:3-isopropylmalate/(R)-2-methylmalate dehydratase small subunit
VVVSAEAVAQLQAGDELVIDLATGSLLNPGKGESYQAAPQDPRAIELLEAGGLIPYLKKKYAA